MFVPALLLATLGHTSCRPEPKDTQSPDTQSPGFGLEDLNGACGYEDRLGRFELAHWDGDGEGFATVTGAVLDGVVPVTILFEVDTGGGCTLWQKVNPYCEQSCQPDEACNHQGECVPYPTAQDLGPVTLAGLTQELTLNADEFGNYWNTSLSYPLFEAGAPVVAAIGGALELRGLGVEPLAQGEDPWSLVPGEDMVVSWVPSTSESLVELTFNIDQHGITPLTMICEVPDTGSTSVPASLLQQLVASGVSGYPSAWIRRRTADSAPWGGGCVDLLVYSHRAADMSVQGYTPCSGDQECPDGQHCNLEQQLCEDD